MTQIIVINGNQPMSGAVSQETDDAYILDGAILPKASFDQHNVALVDVTLPEDFIPSKYAYENGALVKLPEPDPEPVAIVEPQTPAQLTPTVETPQA